MSAFGLTPFGNEAPWGGPGLISIITVLAQGSNKVIAFFTDAPKALDPGGWEDARDPLVWELLPIDPAVLGINGEIIVEPGDRRPSYLPWIGDIEADEDDPTQIIFRTVPGLEPGVSYTLELIGTVRGVNCEEFGGETSFEFRARNLPVPRVDPVAAAVDTFRDWANPYFVTDPRSGQLVEGTGTWLVAEAGDIVLSDNAASLKKRVLRIIQTEEGAFAHLPNFGQRATVKSIAKQSEVQRIASRLQEQIQQFPDVASASVEAKIDVEQAGGILRFRVIVQPRSGGVLSMAFQRPLK